MTFSRGTRRVVADEARLVDAPVPGGWGSITEGAVLRVGLGIGALALAVVASLTVYPRQPAALWVADVVVGGTALVLAAARWRSPAAWLFLTLAAVWWTGSIWTPALYWHRGVVVLLILAAPRLWPPTAVAASTVVIVGLASLAGLPWQNGVIAVTLCGLVLVAAVGRPRTPGRGRSLVASGLLVGGVLSGLAGRQLGLSSTVMIVVYDATLLAALVVVGGLARVPSQATLTDLAVDLGGAPARSVAPLMALVRAEPGLESSLGTAIEYAERLERENARGRAAVHAAIVETDASRRRLVTAAAEERARLADELASIAGAPLRALAERASQAGVGDGLRRAIDDIEDAVAGLRPRGLEHGIAAAVRQLPLVAALGATVELADDRAPTVIEDTLFAVVSEALSNVAKHARAREVGVLYTLDERHARVIVSDDGVGGADTSGTGLAGLADRVEALGGTLTVDSGAGGTRVAASVPTG